MSDGDNVISLQEKREEKAPKSQGRSITGKARCLACSHEWEHAVPEGDDGHFDLWHTCPACGLELGRFVYDITEDGKPVWTCGGCGNELFKVTAEHIYCPVCGTIQTFP
jgi:hypothetical protein